MQMIRIAAMLAIAGSSARADDAVAVETRRAAEPKDDLDLRLTLSSFLFREAGDDATPISMNGTPVETASPVRRYFGDLRIEMADTGLTFDGRIRQTTSERYQSGAAGGAEYEVRRLDYALGSARRKLIFGRQYVDAVGATKIDGVAFVQQVTKRVSGTLFAGAYPALGSRSLDTDYPAIRKADGSEGAPLVPLSGGMGVSYNTPDFHGDVGLAAVYVTQDVFSPTTQASATSSESSRVFAAASGYARPAAWLDIYHFALLDVAGGGGANLTNGSLGINAHATPSIQLTGTIHHVSTDLFQIAARNLLEDPDPDAIGIVQNDIALIRTSQDVVRGGASVALAKSRFEISLSGGYHRRPGVAVALGDGGTVEFPLARSADATLVVLDRKSIGGLRASASASLTTPIGSETPNRSRGAVLRLMAQKTFLDMRAELTADVMVERFRAVTDPTTCMDSLNALACFSTSTTAAAQAGVLGSYQLAREWMFLLDTHVGIQDLDTTTFEGPVAFPRVLSLTVFARAQYRYR